MKIFKGIPVSSGLTKGKVCLYSNEEEGIVPHYNIPEDQVSDEIARMKESFEKTKSSINEIIKVAEKAVDKKSIEIFNVHIMILNDPGLLEKISNLIRDKKVNAEHAVNDVFTDYIDLYEAKQMHFKELAHDFIDLKSRVLSSFNEMKGHFECPVGERESVVVMSQRLTPYMILNIRKENVLAFVTKEGGYTTHATILARSMDIPVIFDVDVNENFKCTDSVIVDGFTGKVILSPDDGTEKYYAEKIEKFNRRKQVCDLKKMLAPRTKSQVRVVLKLNISTPQEMSILNGLNHDGIGLLRTEFLFLEKDKPPSEEEQFLTYKSILEGSQGKPVTVRLLDIGVDKMPLFINLPQQTNPDLGIKGARAVESFYEIYLTQAKALLRASVYGDMRLLYPMVSDLSDIRIFKGLISDARKILKSESRRFSGNLKDGIMIETPAAALMGETLLKHVDFANIGSNDLLQYTLAASRGSPIVEKRYHLLHPSLLKLCEIVVKAGKVHSKEICLCGEIGSFEEFYPLFLKLGLRSFSVAVSKFAFLKCELLHMKIPRTDILKKVYAAETKEEIDKLFRRKHI